MNKLLLGTIVTATFAAAAVPLAFADRDVSHGHHYAHSQKDGGKASLPSQRVEARLTKLKSELKITEAQEAQWNAFAETQRKHALEADKRIEAFRAQKAQNKERPRFNAVERMERQQARLAAMSARMSETLAAMRPLYAALSPGQQKAFDEMRGRHGRHGGHHRRGGHGQGERTS